MNLIASVNRWEMSSRERFLAAINLSEPDHVPLCFLQWSTHPFIDRGIPPRDQFEHACIMLEFGVDDFVGFHNYDYGYLWWLRIREDVKTRVRKEILANEPYPLLIKEYETPKGTLKQVVRQTTGRIRPGDAHWNNWPYGDDIPIFSDHTVPGSRSKRHLVEGMEDLDPFSCLFRDMAAEEIDAVYGYAEKVRRFAEDNEVLIASFGPTLGDAAALVCGIDKLLISAYRDPEFLNKLFDIFHDWNMRCIRLLLKLGGGDVIIHRGWYENGDFWSPRIYRKFIEPRLREEIELANRAGVKYCYLTTTGIMPLLDVFKEMGIDILWGVDPVQGGADLKLVKEELGDRVCFWGGVNSAITLGRGARGEIKEAVRNAISTLAPGGGFVLSPVDALYDDAPAENIATLIETWREISSYPITT